ncbi:lysophospholipid transporter LplT [Massilia sp. S19_KUP03_FR1]|uniref:lysophospholipid transporter LplT n=1 Tax=Massilia sp. S19_KUP03_FR1 TaxID=3025503 RepID=UPI002FCDE128
MKRAINGAPSVRRTLAAVLGAQLLTSLADNALLIVAIALLESGAAPAWATPALRICFYAAYVVLAPLAGPLADRWPKGRLMLLVNLLKLLGAGALACGADPLIVFGAIGLGAAAYAPARYGILPELASGRALVRANAAMEIVTIVSILAGVALGSLMVASGAVKAACIVLAALYALAAASALLVGKSPAQPLAPASGFYAALKTLLRDDSARFSLGVTSVFWACAAVLQFLMIAWARQALGLPLAGAALLPALLALGMVGGALGAGHAHAAATRSAVVLRACLLGGGILAMTQVSSVWAAAVLLLATGVLAGALLVPMNAVLQQRGVSLMRPGVSVAVQNFLENGLSVGFLALYGIGVALGASLDATIYVLGAATIVLVSVLALGKHD